MKSPEKHFYAWRLRSLVLMGLFVVDRDCSGLFEKASNKESRKKYTRAK